MSSIEDIRKDLHDTYRVVEKAMEKVKSAIADLEVYENEIHYCSWCDRNTSICGELMLASNGVGEDLVCKSCIKRKEEESNHGI